MEYTMSVPFMGSASAAIESARLQLMANGFTLEQPSDTELVATGPGMHSTQQNAILGMSHARIVVSASSIDLYAELGGVKTMQRFVYFFPPVLVGGLALTFALIPSFPKEAPLMTLLPAVPWLFISPFMAKFIKDKTTKAVDALVHNMASARGTS